MTPKDFFKLSKEAQTIQRTKEAVALSHSDSNKLEFISEIVGHHHSESLRKDLLHIAGWLRGYLGKEGETVHREPMLPIIDKLEELAK